MDTRTFSGRARKLLARRSHRVRWRCRAWVNVAGVFAFLMALLVNPAQPRRACLGWRCSGSTSASSTSAWERGGVLLRLGMIGSGLVSGGLAYAEVSPTPAAPAQPPAMPAPTLSEETRACLSAFEQAQLKRRAGELRQSTEQLLICASDACPEVIVEKCVLWLSEVNSAIPTVVVAATDGRGEDIDKVRVIVDGRVRATSLDGRPIPVDPGMRRFRFEHARSHSIERELLIVEGAKARRIAIQFETLPTEVVDTPFRFTPLAIVAFSIAGVGAVVGAITGGVALDRSAQLQERCPGKSCYTSDPGLVDYYQTSQTISHVSTVSLSIAGAAAIVGTIGLVVSNVGNDDEPQVTLRVGPGSVAVGGRF